LCFLFPVSCEADIPTPKLPRLNDLAKFGIFGILSDIGNNDVLAFREFANCLTSDVALSADTAGRIQLVNARPVADSFGSCLLCFLFLVSCEADIPTPKLPRFKDLAKFGALVVRSDIGNDNGLTFPESASYLTNRVALRADIAGRIQLVNARHIHVG
jgi:hypothetical protein